ncbi:hypothetical protein [Paenibacillus chitinolyticus]|uniref:hypothetical protein n=1 Tax=Paenibacillus chitinolyticus TaxID=79263 RepID=UPI00366E0F96
MDKRSNDDVGIYNETSNTAGGINTPPDREDKAATDPVSDIVEEIMDNLSGEHPTDPSSDKPADKR